MMETLHPAAAGQRSSDFIILGAFVLHFLLMAISVGTPMVALYLRNCSRSVGINPLHKRMLASFVEIRTMGIGLGVALLVLMFALRPVEMTAPAAQIGMLLITGVVATAAAFLLLHLAQKTHPSIIFEGLGISLLVAVVGTFCALGILIDQTGGWTLDSISPIRLLFQWLPRFAHVLGASITAAAFFHYRITAHDERDKKVLKDILFAGIAWQFVSGIALYTPFDRVSAPGRTIFIIMGAAFAAAALWVLYTRRRTTTVSLAILATFAVMLSGRSELRKENLVSARNDLARVKSTYALKLAAYHPQPFTPISSSAATGSTGSYIFKRACSSCHGEEADGHGQHARNLEVPPEELRGMRTTRSYLYKRLKQGVPGSAMPSFATLDKNQLLKIIDHLEKKHRVLSLAENIPVSLSSAEHEQAEKVYGNLCVRCHGIDGSGWELSDNFRPTLPDFRQYSLTPRRAMEIITDGYTGTAMPPFNNLPVKVRWGLVKIVQMKREQ